ncbi:MAG: hypothetical protein ACI9UK_001142 [Candidatus Krumholzibacteriia bacterium]
MENVVNLARTDSKLSPTIVVFGQKELFSKQPYRLHQYPKVQDQFMTNNDVFTRLRYMFNYSDAELVTIFAAADLEVPQTQVAHWLTGEENPDHVEMRDPELASFLNGLINERRGKKPGAQPVPEKRLNNNIIARKLKIALNLQGQDMIMILALADFNLSNHELSAFFRKKGHTHYRNMNDQVLRYLLRGLQLEIRP